MDTFTAWILSWLGQTAVIALLLGAVGWALRNVIATRLTASVKLETDKKLHEFKTRLDAAENRVDAVQSAGLEAARRMHDATLADQVQAVREIWAGVIDWRVASGLSSIVGAFSLAMVDSDGDLPGTKSTFKTLSDRNVSMTLRHKAMRV